VTHFRPQLRLVPEEIVIRVSDDTLFPIRYPVMLVSESDDAWGFELASELPSWLVLVPGAEESTLDRRLMIHVERACLQDDDLRNKGAAEVELGFTTSVPGCERIAAVIRLYRNQ
jgi:hypothetical protein